LEETLSIKSEMVW